jgi:hypothetical protein
MKNALSLLLLLLLTLSAFAGNVTTYPNVSSVTGADLFFDWQSSAQNNCTAAQLKTYIIGAGSLSVTSGKTETFSNTLTFTGTDSSSVAFGAGGTVLYAAGIGSSVEAWNAKLDTYAALAAPSASGDILSCTTGGTLSWVPAAISVTATGTNTYAATPSPALSAYNSTPVIVTFTNANTGGSSLNLNGLGAVTINQNGAALGSGQIPAGATLELQYNGSVFNIVGNFYTYTLPAATTSTLGGVIPSATYFTVTSGTMTLSACPWSLVTGTPTSAASYGIANGATIDSWGTKTVPSGTVADISSSQTLTNKSLTAPTLTGASTVTQVISPTGTPAAANGTNATTTVTGTNLAGTLQVILSGTSSGAITTLTLANSLSYPNQAIMILTPANAATANLLIADDPYVTGTTTTTGLHTGGTGMPAGTYLWNYVIEGY